MSSIEGLWPGAVFLAAGEAIRRYRGVPLLCHAEAAGGARERRAAIYVAVVASCLVAVAGCGKGRLPETRESIVLANPVMPNGALVFVAAANGYFDREGLEVTLQPHRFGKLALEALLLGKADLAVCAETPIVFAVLGGRQVSVFATIASASKNTALVARKAAGIGNPKDLLGKRIGVAYGTTGEFFLDTFLLRHRVESEDVHIVDMQPAGMSDALARGEVDAVAVWNPIAVELRRRFGAEVLTFFAEDIYFETWNIVGRRDFGRRRPAAARKLLRALLAAAAFLHEHPVEARKAIVSAVPLGPRWSSVLDAYEFRVRLDQSLLGLMDEEARWAIRTRRVDGQDIPNFLDSIAPEPLMAADSGAVQLIR